MKKFWFLNRFLSILGILLVLAIHLSSFSQDVGSYLGKWYGTISVMEQNVEIIVEFTLDENNELKGTMDVPMRGAEGIKLGDIKVEGKKISFGIDDPNILESPIFIGELDKDNLEINGTYSKDSNEGTFFLRKRNQDA